MAKKNLTPEELETLRNKYVKLIRKKIELEQAQDASERELVKIEQELAEINEGIAKLE